MKQFIVLILAFAAVLPLRAQELESPTVPNEHGNYSGAVAPLSISPDAKAMAMGGLQMSTISTSHTIFNNPSTIVFARLPYQLSASYVHMNNLDQFVVSGHIIIARNNALQAGWRNYKYSGIKSQAFDLNYTRKITDRWSMGLTGRYYYQKYASVKKEAVAVDLSTTYVLPLSFGVQSSLRSGAKVGNLGGWLGEGGALPVNFAFGTALDTHFTDAHQLTFGVDFAYFASKNYINGGQISFGAEYNLMQLIQLRAGYHVGSNSPENPNYTSLGCGVRFLHLRLDFAYLIANKNTLLRNTYSLSFGFDM